ncbi:MULTISPECIES: helix-turn-helix domain-containing protein [Bradyrhizobium]|uniref:XRE family transcriptional regulator n=3 Tax=Bradyrhizobium TaxID=374 RepID=A0AAE6CCA6_9BRAD|nr:MULTISPECIES: helix-turn-helix transcriptional regulator [Bradyrhizobium]MCG2632788.1 helix-turn-helix domain-containing protein [Bradyrhizobium zhengyangense]MCG2645443.1 helix-turn-helix domain-containing protein [Bradyrhizobium zhengyangense]MCG2672881.1 helix-turn-helix domain-containing protein [Bradyrhizobium zhengyangense]MDN4988703.1 helix-turn-helix transcriptional regulator [Bradyrhizobium sp. WYCCWR 13022]MDN5006236.1 helix-turn-helix transcriptional regulator [Bradyrhizobium sp.
MDMRKLVGRNFAKLRKQKRFTQEKFADLSGFTQQYISDLERGRRNPTVVSLFQLASALGVTPVDLIAPDEEARNEGKLAKRK